MAEGLEVVVEAARPEDVDGILNVETQCFRAAWMIAQYLNDMERAPVVKGLVARIRGRVVGYASITCLGDQGHIPTLGVLEPFRRQGIGRCLLDALLAHARMMAVSEVVLEVRRSNEAARRLYEGAGFRVIGLRANYYQDPPEDGVVMALELPRPA